MRAEESTVTGGSARNQPDVTEVAGAVAAHVNPDGSVPAGIGRLLRDERGWSGRVIDVLTVLTDSTETMGYLIGGRRQDELATWLSIWTDCPLSVEQIKMVTTARGWDPDPFVTLAGAGLLERLLVAPDGSPRRIDGELAGGWVSDELALADDEEILRRVRQILDAPPEAGRSE